MSRDLGPCQWRDKACRADSLMKATAVGSQGAVGIWSFRNGAGGCAQALVLWGMVLSARLFGSRLLLGEQQQAREMSLPPISSLLRYSANFLGWYSLPQSQSCYVLCQHPSVNAHCLPRNAKISYEYWRPFTQWCSLFQSCLECPLSILRQQRN